MEYEGMVYRPPSEAYSLIIQVTIGCSHNKCRFCSMFKDKRFHIRSLEAITEDLEEMRAYYRRVGRIFLADGDALCLANSKLMAIMDTINRLFPECERVGIYGSAKDILRKTQQELKELVRAGITIVYIGAESGNDRVLEYVNKGVTRTQLIEAVRKAEDAGMAASVTFISGLGGRALWKEHAIDSATMINEMRPTYASWLTLMLDPKAPILKDIQDGSFEQITPMQVMEEMELMLSHIDMPKDTKTVFRSNHASNYISLKGDLPKDRDAMLEQVRAAKDNPALLKPEYFRAL